MLVILVQKEYFLINNVIYG